MSNAIRCRKCQAELPPDAPAGMCPRCLLQAGFESQSHTSSQAEPTEPSPAARQANFVPPTVAELAGRLPQLEILALLGQGGMGAVYKARQPALDRLVAVKVLPAEIGNAPTFPERFMREARALAKLSHPNIVSVYDFGQAEDMYYFVMDYVDGVNLREGMQSHAIQPAEALAIVPQICEALQYAHDEGVVHRDIKPENILIDKRGRVKIADFGLAKLLGSDPSDHALTGTQQVMGTLRYMAPEQMQGARKVDHRADIYSLGVVFYELLTGELPIGRFAPPSKKVRIDVRLDEVVLRALEYEPEQRYQHASELRTDVESVKQSPAPAEVSGSEPVATPASFLDPDLEVAVGKLYQTKGKIPAIKLYRDLTGAGLAVAKLAVESLAARRGWVEGKSHNEWPAILAWLLLFGAVGLGLSLQLSSVIRWPLLILGFFAPLVIGLLRKPRTDETRKRNLLIGVLAWLCIFPNLFLLALKPEDSLAKLYSATDTKPAAHDLVLVNIAAWGALLGGSVWLLSLAFDTNKRNSPSRMPPLQPLATGHEEPPQVIESSPPVGERSPRQQAFDRALETWWRRQPRIVQHVTHGLLAIVYLLGFVMFMTFHSVSMADGHQFTLGTPSPWLNYETSDTGTHFNVMLLSWAYVPLALAWLALGLWRRFERLDRGQAHGMLGHYALWIVVLAIAVTAVVNNGLAKQRERIANTTSAAGKQTKSSVKAIPASDKVPASSDDSLSPPSNAGKQVPPTPGELEHILGELPEQFTSGLLGNAKQGVKDLDTRVWAIDFDDGPADFWLEVKETGQQSFPARLPSRKAQDVWRIPGEKAHLLMWIQPRDSVNMSAQFRGVVGRMGAGCTLGIDVDGKTVARINYDVPERGVGQAIPHPLWFGWRSEETNLLSIGESQEMAPALLHFVRKSVPVDIPATVEFALRYRRDPEP